MDFTKFVSCLINGGIYLPRADLLGDPFEGTITQLNLERRKAFYSEIYPESDKAAPVSFDQFESNAVNWTFNTRKTMYVSCWHMNEAESAAMWTLYAKSGEAIAVQSTFTRLSQCSEEDFYIGVVKYIDYDRAVIPEGNSFWPFLHKRKSFTHERELRLIQWKEVTKDKVWYPNPEEGYWLPVKMQSLIERIFVSPNSSQWYVDLVIAVIEKFCPGIEVKQSELGKTPVF